MDWKTRLRHPAFWTGMVASLIILTQQMGVPIFPENTPEIVNTILIIAAMLGIVVDSSTEGITDKPKPAEEIKAEEK